MIKNYTVYFILCFISIKSFSQNVINLVMVGPEGVTQDAQKATSFIVVKQYPDLHFERLDYNKGGPLVMVRTYKGQDLEILDGRYFEYATDGSLLMSGKYLNNLKEGEWRTYNDTGKVIKTVRYSKDSMIEVIDLDKKDSLVKYPDEQEASFPGGDKAWRKYLIKKLENDNPSEKSFHGGKVSISFVVGTDGSIGELFVSKSVEYILDETSLKIIGSSPKWKPAFQNGRNVRAYRRQPLSFIKE